MWSPGGTGGGHLGGICRTRCSAALLPGRGTSGHLLVPPALGSTPFNSCCLARVHHRDSCGGSLSGSNKRLRAGLASGPSARGRSSFLVHSRVGFVYGLSVRITQSTGYQP